MNSDQWKTFLARLTKAGFQLKNADLGHPLKMYAEFYEWNRWTVAVGAGNPFDRVEKITVELYFDSAALDYRNKTFQFDAETDQESAFTCARNLVRSMRGDLLSDAFAE